MKKYLLSALALPLLFACSSEDYLDQKAADNDQFAGIEKVDATFSMADSPSMRMANNWTLEGGDVWGFAWMTDAHTATTPYAPVIAIDGKAYQNHNLIQEKENGTNVFKPQTSIYVGQYYLYRPYDETTVSPQAINFKSLEEQPLADGYASTTDAWKAVAAKAINIGDKFTDVTPDGHTIGTDPTIWDNAGTKGHYKLNGAMFSNQTGLDLTYQKNNVEAPAAGMHIAGATDIDYTIAAGTKIGAADIYEATVQLQGADKSFTYAPKQEPNGGTHAGTFWANKSDLNGNNIASATGDAFGWNAGAITLKAADENGVSTDKSDNKGWFWFNSLPVTAGNATTASTVDVTLTTSYGVVTINSTVGACAYAFEQYTAGTGSKEWIQLAAADVNTTTPKTWNLAGAHNTFINQYGDHKGKFALTADFSTGVMNNMHIKNDAHLQKLLKYYIAAAKTETGVVLNLDADANGEFKISKLSIALLQTINATTTNVTVQACTTHGTPKIIVTQDGSAGKTEVPALDKVFNTATDVYLASDCKWTWSGGGEAAGWDDALTIDANVASITNEGKLTVNATNVELSLNAVRIYNAAGATMNITKVTTAKNTIHNYGTINVGAADNTSAELRAYEKWIVNNASALGVSGVINNYGVVGVSAGTAGKFNNYGVINMMNNDAITLLSANEQGTSPFTKAFGGANKMGTVVLPENNPTAIVSVTNTAATGFIKYNWTGATYATPEGNVKYNTIVVSNNITFNAIEDEIQFIEFNGTRTQVVNPAAANLPNLKGVIVNGGKSIILEATNVLDPSQGVFLGTGATVYRGGQFTIGGAAIASPANTTNYLGTWSLDQIVEY